MVNAEKTVGGVISLVISVIFFLATIPTIVDEVSNVNTTDWDFTGSDGAESMLGLIPFAYIVAGLLFAVVGSLALARGLRGD